VSDCIEWTGCKDRDGYGTKYIGGGKRKRVHRIALEEKLGRPIRLGHQACHTCDNPLCINQDHLWEGTPAENKQDSVRKNRHSGNRKLTSSQVREILGRGSERSDILAVEFGISRGHVDSIRRRQTWSKILLV